MKNIQQVLDLEFQHYKSAEMTVFFLYIKTNQIHNRGEGPHFFFSLYIKAYNYWNNCPHRLYNTQQ